MQSFKDLEVWQKSVDLTLEIYKLTKRFPKEEKFDLISQMRRCAISVPSNIAEGWGRESTKQYIHFLFIARGSMYELETQAIIANRLKYLDNDSHSVLTNRMTSICMMLNKLISTLKRRL